MYHDYQFHTCVVLKLRQKENFSVKLFEPAAPIRAGKIEQQKFVTSLSFLLSFLVISEPVRLRAGERPGDKNKGRNREKKKTMGFHVTIFGGNTASRKSPERIRDQRSNYF